MGKIFEKYTRKTGYKILRKIARRLGYDIIPFESEKMGICPYRDMAKFVTRDQPVLFDVGANYGQTIDDFREVLQDAVIHSFEPSPDVFGPLKNKASKMRNVHVWNYAVGASPGSLVLNENTHQNMSSFLEIGEDGWGTIEHKTTVPVTTIDEFCKEQKIERIDVLKIDTQGFELEVFKGALNSMRNNKIGLLYFEVTFIDMYKGLPGLAELFEFAVNNGFELVAIYPIKYRNNMAGWTDILFKNRNYN